MIELIELGENYVVNVDSELIPSSRYDYIDKKKNVIRHWGMDERGRRWTSHVFYPKKHFTKEHLEKNVLKKYLSCPYCRIKNPSSFDNDDKKTMKSSFESYLEQKKKKKYYIGEYGKIILGTGLLSMGLFAAVFLISTRLSET